MKMKVENEVERDASYVVSTFPDTGHILGARWFQKKIMIVVVIKLT